MKSKESEIRIIVYTPLFLRSLLHKATSLKLRFHRRQEGPSLLPSFNVSEEVNHWPLRTERSVSSQRLNTTFWSVSVDERCLSRSYVAKLMWLCSLFPFYQTITKISIYVPLVILVSFVSTPLNIRSSHGSQWSSTECSSDDVIQLQWTEWTHIIISWTTAAMERGKVVPNDRR